MDDEYFGDLDQRSLMQRSRLLWELLKEDPRMTYYGRAVSLTSYGSDATDLVTALARLQGVSSCVYTPHSKMTPFIESLEARGLKTDRFEVLRGESEALELAHRVLDEHLLPDDLEVISIDAGTEPSIIAELDEITRSCGVLLPLGSVMRGVTRKSVCLLARDRIGKPVASAASVAFNHPEGPHGRDAWWGMLATREDRRGERIALVLGAMAMVAMHREHGFEFFATGVRQGNKASEKLCARLGVLPSDYANAMAIDPASYSGDRMTK